ncbi:Hypothetical Protein FCC1311_093932 [Hondaea fermentalgiana]|uniref:Uncharacterized protein n=1 Tax=Hondaea fermentalgiana TaxID=2315210 RepID=A0A2R5GS87_9STRA|nr:Hypothetical Protein FCC1311_093932 [Hondaea fermentalgiana]|eukprot:GBG33169.1 Hypothetical Protein FCC1311_093932 [Hondaea fermentalgiana]
MGSGLTKPAGEAGALARLQEIRSENLQSGDIDNDQNKDAETLRAELCEIKTALCKVNLEDLIKEARLADAKAKLERLRTIDPFVLDNSMRETTVAQVKGHSLQDKLEILKHVRKTGLEHIIVGALGRLKRVDNELLEYFQDQNEDRSKFYLFTELFEKVDPDTRLPNATLPASLQIAKDCGIPNVIVEIDLSHPDIDWNAALPRESDPPYFALLADRVAWIRAHLCADARIFFNFRDWLVTWHNHPTRVERVASFFANAAPEERIMGFCVEDPSGAFLPFQYADPVQRLREAMDQHDWADGHILVHIHKNYGLAEASALEVLALGATGVWCGIPDEGAAVGHACSCVLLTNLARLGNTRVLERYNFPALREAAIEITRLITDEPPHPRTEVYGARALDVIFEGINTANDPLAKNFDVNTLFQVPVQTRISTMATAPMMADRLAEVFGPEARQTASVAVCEQMVETLHDDLRQGREEEYQSTVGIFSLFERSGGVPTEAMISVIDHDASLDKHPVLVALRAYFDVWDYKDHAKDDCISFDNFYDAFMARFLTCYSCEKARKLFAAADLSHDGAIQWREIALRAKWALTEYPKLVTNVQDLIGVIMERYFLPEMLRTCQT